MNSPSSLDPIAQFLKTLSPRCCDTYRVYACILRGFHLHLAEQDPQVSADTIRTWLKQRILEWPLPLVIHRARLVDRYLDWAKAHDVVAHNPFAELRERYGGLTAPIVRALLSDDPGHELERLRPLPEFGSALGPEMRQHVQLLRSLGYRADERKKMLLQFDRFLQRRPDLQNESLANLVQAWSEAGCSPRRVLDAQRCGQVLSEVRHRLDPAVPILRADRDLRRRIVRQVQATPRVHGIRGGPTVRSSAFLCLSESAAPSPDCLHDVGRTVLRRATGGGTCAPEACGHVVRKWHPGDTRNEVLQVSAVATRSGCS